MIRGTRHVDAWAVKLGCKWPERLNRLRQQFLLLDSAYVIDWFLPHGKLFARIITKRFRVNRGVFCLIRRV